MKIKFSLMMAAVFLSFVFLPAVFAEGEKSEEAQAEEYFRSQDWNKAVAAYESLLSKNPNDSVMFRRLIDAYMQAKNYEAVIQKLVPLGDNETYSNTLANAYVGAGRSTEAVALYKKKIEKDSGSPGLRGRYAQALTDFNMLDDALKEWQKAFELDPRNLLFKQRVAEIYLAQGKTQEAKKEFEELRNLAGDKQPWFKDIANSQLQAIQ